MDLFARLSEGRPQREPTQAPTPLAPSWAARELLDWLQNVWKQPTVSGTAIRQFGPNCIRDPKIGLDAAETLVRRGSALPLANAPAQLEAMADHARA